MLVQLGFNGSRCSCFRIKLLLVDVTLCGNMKQDAPGTPKGTRQTAPRIFMPINRRDINESNGRRAESQGGPRLSNSANNAEYNSISLSFDCSQRFYSDFPFLALAILLSNLARLFSHYKFIA